MTSDKACIDGVFVKLRKKVEDERGAIFHVMRADSPDFVAFGEVYVSTLKGRVVKAWRRHRTMYQSITVPVGGVKIVIFDDRNGSNTKGQVDVHELGPSEYCMIRIPPDVWYGFCGMTDTTSILVNCASIVHDPAEIERIPSDSDVIPYSWT